MIVKFLKDWKESLIGIPIILTIFLVYPLLHSNPENPEAQAGWGAVHLQKILFAVAATLIANTISWIGLRLDSKNQFQFSNTDYTLKLSPWQRALLLYWRLSLYCLVFALALQAL